MKDKWKAAGKRVPGKGWGENRTKPYEEKAPCLEAGRQAAYPGAEGEEGQGPGNRKSVSQDKGLGIPSQYKPQDHDENQWMGCP